MYESLFDIHGYRAPRLPTRLPRLVSLACVLLLLFPMRTSAEVQPAAKPVVKIAFILPLSGDWAFLGTGIRDAALLAQNDLVRTKLQYRLYFEDNQGKLKESLTAARKLMAVEKVDAFVSIISGVGEILNPLAEEAKIINVGICSNTSVAEGKFNFINYLTAEQGVDKFLREFQDRYPVQPTLAIFSLNEAGFNFIGDELKRRKAEFNVSIAAVETFEPKTSDFRSQILRALRQKPRALLILGLSPEIELLGMQLGQLGKDLPLVSIEGFGLANDKSVFEGGWFIDAAVPNKAFRERFTENYGREVTAGAGHAYDTVMMIAAAFEKASKAGAKPSPEDAAAELNGVKNYQGVVGIVSVDPSGIFHTEPSVKIIRNGKAELIE